MSVPYWQQDCQEIGGWKLQPLGVRDARKRHVHHDDAGDEPHHHEQPDRDPEIAMQNDRRLPEDASHITAPLSQDTQHYLKPGNFTE